MQFLKKIAISFIALIVLFSQLAISLGDISVSANNDITLRVGLKDEVFTKSERVTFDVWARDASDTKIDDSYVEVTNELEDGTIEPVNINWSDEVKTSYTAWLTEGVNKIVVNVVFEGQELSKTIYITYEEAEIGDVIGEFTFSMDGFVVGMGYFIEPIKVPIINGDNGAYHLERILFDHEFTYNNTGNLDSGFYLSSIEGGNLLDKEYPPTIPPEVIEEINKRGEAEPDPYQYEPEGWGLGEFDFNHMSGWMYSVNNVFPNVGFSDYYLLNDDVMRVQFTVAYGSDIGGGYASGGTEYDQYFPQVNKDYLTEIAATINSSPFKAELYANTDLEMHYRNVVDNVLPTVNISQEALDEAEANLRTRYEEALPVAITKTIDTLPADAKDSEPELMALIRYQLDKLSSKQLAAITNLSKFELLEDPSLQPTTPEHVQAVIDDIAALPTTITLENGDNVVQLYETYTALTAEEQALVTNAAALTTAYSTYTDLKKADDVEQQLFALPSAANLALADEPLLLAAAEAYAALTDTQKAYVTSAAIIESLTAQLELLKQAQQDTEKMKAAVEPVEKLIGALPTKEKIELSHATAIQQAQTAFDALLETYKSHVSNKATLVEATAALQVLQNIDAITKKIAALPSVEAVTLQDEQQVVAVANLFNALTTEQQKLVANAQLLVALNEKLQQLKAPQPNTAVQNVITAIDSLPAVAKLTDEAMYNNIKAVYDALKPEDKILVMNVTKFIEFGEQLTALKGNSNQTVINEVIALINSLPTEMALTVQHEASLTMVEKIFNGLTKAQQAKVTNSAKLSSLSLKLVELKARQQDEAAIKKVVDDITAIPNATLVTLSNKQYIESVRTQYEALTYAQKTKITNVDKLVAAENKLQQLTKAVEEVIAGINNLPTTLTKEHVAVVASLRAKFDALDVAQKMAVTNVTKLLEAEQLIQKLEQTEEPQEGNNLVTPEELKEAVKESEGITAVETNEKDQTIIVAVDKNSEKPSILSNNLMNKIQSMTAQKVIVAANHNIKVEIPKAIFTSDFSKGAAFSVNARPSTTGFTPIVKVDFAEVLTNGIKRDLAFTKQYVKVKVPLSLFKKPTASLTATAANEQGVILRKTEDGFEAVPHKIVDGEAIIFANTTAEYVYSTDVVTFDDIANVSNKGDIEFLASRYVVKGYDENSYGPGKSITRSQFATMIARSLNLIAEDEAVHTDTKGKAYEEAVQSLYEAGITNAKGEFKPGQTLTREQAASFMYRILKYTNYDFKENQKPISLTDLHKIDRTHLPAVLALYELDIISGKADGRFDPKGHLTRGQMAKMLRLTLERAGMM